MSADASPFGRSLAQLRQAYARGETTPSEVIAGVRAEIERTREANAWITVADLADLLAAAARLEAIARDAGGFEHLPLYGVPLAVKDNIDVAGFPTTNACPDFAYQPERSATAVQRAIDAGAIVVGKTNLDQFATGLVGTRSPYGIGESVFGQGIVSGGSSSGSAIAVATGVVPVALATDTAGSGRVPAALNGIIGIKPTLGLVSTLGLQPACRTIDGITVMGTSVEDALTLLTVIVGPDPDNPWGRDDAALTPTTLTTAVTIDGRPLRLGVPAASALEFFGDEPMRAAHLAARRRALTELGAEPVEIDLEPFLAAGALLYQGAWVAERLADLEGFLADHPVSTHPDSVHPVVRGIIESGAQYSAADAFRTQHRLRNLRHLTSKVWDDVDALLLPTIGTTFTIDEVLAEPLARNATLGHYTHFTNLLDLAALSLPAGTTSDGRPAALMLIGPPRSDLTLTSIAAVLLGELAAFNELDAFSESAASNESGVSSESGESNPRGAAMPDPDQLNHTDPLNHADQPDQPASVPAEPYPFEFSLDDTALVIIDMQRDFVEPGGFGESLGNDVDQLRAVIPVLAGVLEQARDAGMLVIHTREGHLPDLSDCPPSKLNRGKPSQRIGDPSPNGRILIRGEKGHDIIEELYPIDGEPVVDKPGKGAFYATEFADILAEHGIHRLVVTGVTTEVCVHTTVREANDRGYECLVLSDCVGSYFPDFQRIGLQMIAAQGGIFGWVAPAAAFRESLTAIKTGPAPATTVR